MSLSVHALMTFKDFDYINHFDYIGIFRSMAVYFSEKFKFEQ